MAINEALMTALNEIRETSIDDGTLYAKYVPEIHLNSDISTFAVPLLENPKVMNDFIDVLVKRIVYTQVQVKLFRNPLKILEGDELPLGAIGQEIFVNPIRGRVFNVNDFAGLLAKYEADVKVQYHELNSDLQYPVTITRAKIKDAFVSWDELNSFINGITQALYNGAYIDEYNLTKDLVATAYKNNNVQIEVVDGINSEAYAKAFLTKARTIYLNMQTPTSRFNAWRKVGGYGNDVLTFTAPEDIVFLIRNDLASYIDVNVLASAFNIDKTTLLGRIIYVNDFDTYSNDGTKIYDGSAIVGMIADRTWFRIKTQEMTMDEFYNANNRTWQYYLNVVKMYSYSLFANGVVFATSLPNVPATKIEFVDDTAFEIEEGEKIRRTLAITPINSTSTVTFTSSDATILKVTKVSDTEVEIEGVSTDADSITITATCGNLTDTISGKCVSGT